MLPSLPGGVVTRAKEACRRPGGASRGLILVGFIPKLREDGTSAAKQDALGKGTEIQIRYDPTGWSAGLQGADQRALVPFCRACHRGLRVGRNDPAKPAAVDPVIGERFDRSCDQNFWCRAGVSASIETRQSQGRATPSSAPTRRQARTRARVRRNNSVNRA